MFFGSGRKNKFANLDQNTAIVLNYGYFHLMFAFRVTYGYRYSLATKTQQGWSYKDVTKEEALQRLGTAQLRPSWWERYSLYLALGASVVWVIILGFIEQ